MSEPERDGVTRRAVLGGAASLPLVFYLCHLRRVLSGDSASVLERGKRRARRVFVRDGDYGGGTS